METYGIEFHADAIWGDFIFFGGTNRLGTQFEIDDYESSAGLYSVEYSAEIIDAIFDIP